MLEYNSRILPLKVVLAILEALAFATAEEPVKDGKQQEKDDSIQYSQLDLCLWPRNQAIHTNYTINMGKKRHLLLEMIGETTNFIPWCWEFFPMAPCLQ